MSYTGDAYFDVKTALGEFWRDFDIEAIVHELDSNYDESDDYDGSAFLDIVKAHELKTWECYNDNDRIISFGVAIQFMDTDLMEQLNSVTTADTSTGTGRYQYLKEFAELYEDRYGEGFFPFDDSCAW